MPFAADIQRSFGDHDIGHVEAHSDASALAGTKAMGAGAFASGNKIVLGDKQDKHTVAHEVAHVMQQRAGVQLLGGVGAAGDEYERNADAIADRVVAGQSAVDLLPAKGKTAAPVHGHDAVQRAPAASATPLPIASPLAGINSSGFIDTSDGANLRTGPIEAGGALVIAAPLPPATRVFVSGTHPTATQWLYVTAFLPEQIVRGYVQNFRVNTVLPEPLAKLYEIKSGDTAERLASREYGSSVRDGHDLRYFENVLLHTNKGRSGIKGTLNDAGVLSALNMEAMKKGRASNIELVAGHRIWVVSSSFAKSLEGVLPDASLTNGVYAKAKRFVGHIVDLIKSVTESPNHLAAVAGQYAQAIRDHMPEIIGIIAAFVAAEAASAFLAVSPTGVGQIAAVVIQLALSAFGVAGMVQAGIAATQHASAWLTTAWTAQGNDAKITVASKEFLHMLVSLAMAALAYTGAKGNMGNAIKIANTMPPMGLVPAMAVANGGRMPLPGGTTAGVGVKLGMPGPQGTVGTAMAMSGKPEPDGSSNATAEVTWTAHGNKHVANGRVPWQKVVESTKNGPAKYLPNTAIEALERMVSRLGNPVTNGKTWKVMEFPNEIGASGGKSSRWVRVEESAGTIHGHPITFAEFTKLTKVQ